ncbi:MAG TPA: drug/metabolite exporter YedA [Aggregatilineales bacterium]|nr:drug/metabolite exporter YedA [Aggregatilineales bacterium]
MVTEAAPRHDVLSNVQPAATQGRADQRAWIILALLTVYIIWGTTYLGIRLALESFPPFLMMGIRFVTAGGGLLFFLRLRGTPMPTRKQWRSAAIVGGLLMVGGMGLTATAEETVSSGLTATLVAAAPLWTLIFSLIWKHRPTRIEWLGVAVGLIGVGLLSLEGNLRANPAGIVLMLFASACWALGSVWSTHLEIAPGAMGNASEMLCGGVMLVTLGLLGGQRITAMPTTSALLALVYLTTFGSLATMSAYMFLLKTVSHSLATSYAFVNPAIALLLGMAIGGEHLTGGALIALPVILMGVAFVAFGRQHTALSSDKR